MKTKSHYYLCCRDFKLFFCSPRRIRTLSHLIRSQVSFQLNDGTNSSVFPDCQLPYHNFEVFNSSVDKQDFVARVGLEPTKPRLYQLSYLAIFNNPHYMDNHKFLDSYIFDVPFHIPQRNLFGHYFLLV